MGRKRIAASDERVRKLKPKVKEGSGDVFADIGLRTPDHQEYAALLAKILPLPIKSEALNRHFTSILESLMEKKRKSKAERWMIELLAALIGDFEDGSLWLRQQQRKSARSLPSR